MTPSAASALVIGYLGPPGTFSEAALHGQPDLAGHTALAMSSISDVIAAVSEGEIDLGLVPIENAIEGSVNVTADSLAFDTDLLIQREVTLRVELDLMARPGVELGDIRRILSIPIASAQCRHFLRDELPGIPIEATNSTAEAARIVAEGGATDVAALAPSRSAEVYGLSILAADVEDHPENSTRFVIVARDGVPAPTGHDKTSIVVFQQADAPGSLLSILQEFAARSINLTRLESRPTKRSLGDYCFLIDLEGHISDEVVADALRNLHVKQARVKFLGSYPAAGDHGPQLRQEASKRWAEAESWISGLRDRLPPT